MSRTVELLRLLCVCERVEGRKKLQKLVHILREAGHPFAYRYGYHFHGPFSTELKGEIDALVEEKLIIEHPGESDFGDFIQYTYRPGEGASALLDSLGHRSPVAWASLAKDLNAKSAQELEAISTIIYLIRNGCTTESLLDRFGQLKPYLAGQFEGASKYAQFLTAARSKQLA